VAANETQSTDCKLPRVLGSLPRNLHPRDAQSSCELLPHWPWRNGSLLPTGMPTVQGRGCPEPTLICPTVLSQPSQLWLTGGHPKGLLCSPLVHLSTQYEATSQTPSKPKRPAVLPHIFLGRMLMAYPQCTSRQPKAAAREDGFFKPHVATGRAMSPCPQISGEAKERRGSEPTEPCNHLISLSPLSSLPYNLATSLKMSESPFRSHFRQFYSAEHHRLMREINQSAQWTRGNKRAAAEQTKPASSPGNSET